MKLVKLIHPVHGEITKRQTIKTANTFFIMRQWKLKYGKKYYECSVEVEDIGKSKEYIRNYR